MSSRSSFYNPGIDGDDNDAENPLSPKADTKDVENPSVDEAESAKKLDDKDENEKMDVDESGSKVEVNSTISDSKPESESKENDDQEENEKTKEKVKKEEDSKTSDAEEDGEDDEDRGKKRRKSSSAKDEDVKEPDIEEVEAEKVLKPRPLHRTASIFLRNLAPTITKQEVEAMCKRYPGFLRVAIADPQPDRRWFRRGWVTFERNVNIKEICWNLNNIRLRDCELGAIVNRDLSRRIRTVSGITSHKQVVRHDIKLTAKIVHNLDEKAGLWTNESTPAAAATTDEVEKQTLDEPKESSEVSKSEKQDGNQVSGWWIYVPFV